MQKKAQIMDAGEFLGAALLHMHAIYTLNHELLIYLLN